MEEEYEQVTPNVTPNTYLVDSVQSNVYKYDIDEDFEQPTRIRDLLRLLDNQTENDTTILRVNHRGGCKFMLIAVINAIQSSKGTVIAEVIHASSAGSLVSLACDDCYTVKFGEFYIHEEQSVNFGDLSYRKSQINFSEKTQRHLFDEIYTGFLTEDEIGKLCDGTVREFNFDYIEANERLVNWRKYKESKEEMEKSDIDLVKEIYTGFLTEDENIKEEIKEKDD